MGNNNKWYEENSMKKNNQKTSNMEKIVKHDTAWKVSKYGVISVPYFPVFGLNTEIYW